MTILALCLMFTLGAFIGIGLFIAICVYFVDKEAEETERRLSAHPSGQKDILPFNVIDLSKK